MCTSKGKNIGEELGISPQAQQVWLGDEKRTHVSTVEDCLGKLTIDPERVCEESLASVRPRRTIAAARRYLTFMFVGFSCDACRPRWEVGTGSEGQGASQWQGTDGVDEDRRQVGASAHGGG